MKLNNNTYNGKINDVDIKINRNIIATITVIDC